MHQLKIPETLLQKRIFQFYFQSTKNIRFQDKWNFKLFRELYTWYVPEENYEFFQNLTRKYGAWLYL
jgi:hypothetical protein